MRPLHSDSYTRSRVIGRYVCVSACLPVGRYLGHVRESCQNGWTDRDADPGGLNEPYIRWGSTSPTETGTFEGPVLWGSVIIVSWAITAERYTCAIHHRKAHGLRNIKIQLVRRTTFAFTRNKRFKTMNFAKHAAEFSPPLQTTNA